MSVEVIGVLIPIIVPLGIFAMIVFIRKYEAQPLLWEIWSYLDGFGYSMYALEEVKIGLYGSAAGGLRDGQWNQGDAVFIARELRQALDS